MTRKEERNNFINSYLGQYDGDSYEAYAEREDIGAACSDAIEWADRTMIEKACRWIGSHLLSPWQANYLDDFSKAMES